MNRVVTIILAAVLMSTMLTAQQPAPTFEIASVRPNVSDTPPSMRVPSQGAVAITNVPLINIITNAYATPSFRIVGVPEWVQRERFDVTARPPDDPSPNQLAMLRTLEERFKLRVHRESGERPADDLLIASTNGRLGPRLKRAATDCSAATFTVPSGDSPCAGGLMGVGPAGGIIVTKGLKLESTRAPVEVLVIDAVDRPTAD